MAAEYIETRNIPLADLTQFPGNAKVGDVETIRASLRRTGQYRALVVRDTGDGLVILAGNHTSMALAAEGHTTARCEIIQCSDDEARRINLADNKTAELGSYDDDALVELLSYLDDDYTGTGWTAGDIEYLITPPPDLDQLAAEYGEPEDNDLWPILRFKISPEVRDDFLDLTARCEQPSDMTIRFLYLLQRLRAMA